MENLELQDFTIQPGMIDKSQFEKINDYALDIKAKYQDLKLNDDNLSELKDVHARLNKLITSLETERKRVKQLWNKPYEEFESAYKKAVQPINEAKALINNQITDYETKRKNDHIDSVNEWFEKEARDMAPGLYEFVSSHPAIKARVFKAEYYNLTYSAIKREDETRKALREVHQTIEQIADDTELLDIYAEIGSYIDAISERKARRERQEKLKRQLASSSASKPEHDTKAEPEQMPYEEATKPAMHTVSFDFPCALTDDDLKPAAFTRRFKGPKYRLLALFEIAKKLDLEVIKVNK